MDALFWERLHGASTHLPIVLPPISVLVDFFGRKSRDERLRAVYHRVGMALAIGGAGGSFVAVAAGLVMSDGKLIGSGAEKLHHLFVWPAFILMMALVAWRFFLRLRFERRHWFVYLTGMSLVCALMAGAGYWGGEMLLRSAPGPTVELSNASASTANAVSRGHELFLMNCAHCHGEDARGTDDGPDLTRFRKSDARIASVVRNGIKGEMPRFDQKLHDEDVQFLIRFVRSLKAR